MLNSESVIQREEKTGSPSGFCTFVVIMQDAKHNRFVQSGTAVIGKYLTMKDC